MNHRLRRLTYIPFMLPAVVTGAVIMGINQLPPFVCLFNMICLLVLSVLALLPSERMINRMRQGIKGKGRYALYIAAFAILILTFFDKGLEGVHRWISIGSLRLHGAVIVLPLLIGALWKTAQERGSKKRACAAALFVLVLLMAQPDASQVTGAGAALALLIAGTKAEPKRKVLMLIPVIAAVLYSWFRLDLLAPVAHVEGILRLAEEESTLFLIAGVVSLGILPLPFLLFRPKNAWLLSISIGGYYIGIILSSIVAAFPVPLLGYGVSPVIGFFLSFLWLSSQRHE